MLVKIWAILPCAKFCVCGIVDKFFSHGPVFNIVGETPPGVLKLRKSSCAHLKEQLVLPCDPDFYQNWLIWSREIAS